MARLATYRVMYNTPLGMKFTEVEAESFKDAEHVALGDWLGSPVVDVLSVERLGYKCAEDGDGEPLDGGGDVLAPEPTPAGRCHEALRNLHVKLLANHGVVDPVRGDSLKGVKDKIVLLFGDHYQVVFRKLTKHVYLVKDVHLFELLEALSQIPVLEASLADLPAEHDEVQGDRLHDDHHQG